MFARAKLLVGAASTIARHTRSEPIKNHPPALGKRQQRVAPQKEQKPKKKNSRAPAEKSQVLKLIFVSFVSWSAREKPVGSHYFKSLYCTCTPLAVPYARRKCRSKLRRQMFCRKKNHTLNIQYYPQGRTRVVAHRMARASERLPFSSGLPGGPSCAGPLRTLSHLYIFFFFLVLLFFPCAGVFRGR